MVGTALYTCSCVFNMLVEMYQISNSAAQILKRIRVNILHICLCFQVADDLIGRRPSGDHLLSSSHASTAKVSVSAGLLQLTC